MLAPQTDSKNYTPMVLDISDVLLIVGTARWENATLPVETTDHPPVILTWVKQSPTEDFESTMFNLEYPILSLGIYPVLYTHDANHPPSSVRQIPIMPRPASI